jgi:hypothetical protein
MRSHISNYCSLITITWKYKQTPWESPQNFLHEHGHTSYEYFKTKLLGTAPGWLQVVWGLTGSDDLHACPQRHTHTHGLKHEWIWFVGKVVSSKHLQSLTVNPSRSLHVPWMHRLHLCLAASYLELHPPMNTSKLLFWLLFYSADCCLEPNVWPSTLQGESYLCFENYHYRTPYRVCDWDLSVP